MAGFIKLVVDAVSHKNATQLVWLSLAVIGLYVFKYVFTRGQAYYLSRAAARLTSDLRLRVYEKLQRLPIGYFNEKRSGAIQSVLTNDINVYQNAVTAVRDSIDGPIKVLVGTITIFILQWKLALAGIVVLPILAAVIQRNSRKMKVAQEQVQTDLASLTAMMQESLQGVRVVKSFGAEQTMIDRFQVLIEHSFQSQMQAVRRIANLRPMVELIGAGGLAFVVLLCAKLVSDGLLEVGDLAGFLMALDVINQGAKQLGALRQTTAQVEAATDRIYDQVLNAPEPAEESSSGEELPSPQGRIEFRHVSFRYPDGTCALSDVSFELQPGESLAVVGPSGAGKSTLADLMLRFYDPTEGEVLLDGVDIRTLNPRWYRSLIGVVPQQTFLFAGTIADNLRLGAQQASDDQLRHAAESAHLHGVLERDGGLNSELGERGARLSGGEAQRIAIARALVRDPLILLLDEATSSLDAITEKRVQEELQEAMRGRTTLFIAHRLTTAARADRILVLRKGEALELGSHEQLMAKDGIYAGMFRAFTSGVMPDELG